VFPEILFLQPTLLRCTGEPPLRISGAEEIRVAFPVSGATPVQPPYYGVDNIDAVDKFTPGFVTRQTLHHSVDAIDTLSN
jgi:hypothetical protein